MYQYQPQHQYRGHEAEAKITPTDDPPNIFDERLIDTLNLEWANRKEAALNTRWHTND